MNGYIDIFVKLFASIFKMYMLYDFFATAFEVRSLLRNRLLRILAMLTTSIIIVYINSFNNTIINMFGVTFVSWLLLWLMFEGSRAVFNAYFIIAQVIFFAAEFIYAISRLISDEFWGTNQRLLSESDSMNFLILVVIEFVFFQIIKRIPKKSNRYMDLKTFLMFLILPISNLGIMIFTFYSDNNFDEKSIVNSILICFYCLMVVGNVLTFYAFNRYTETVAKSNAQELQLSTQEMKLRHYAQMEMINDTHKEMIHDINHYMKIIAQLANEDNNTQILTMIEQLQIEFQEVNTLRYTTIPIINVILSEHAAYANKKNVEFNVFVEAAFSQGRVRDVDIIAILGNLLDNAIEAASGCSEGEVMIDMFMQNDGKFSVIKVVNNYNKKLIKIGDKLATTKDDSRMHGIGISSVQHMAEKYGGYLQNSYDGNVFTSVIILPS